MKIKAGQAIFGILELTLDIAATQRAMNHLILQDMANGNEKIYQELLIHLNSGVNRELDLLRARLFRYSEIDINDILKGEIDF